MTAESFSLGQPPARLLIGEVLASYAEMLPTESMSRPHQRYEALRELQQDYLIIGIALVGGWIIGLLDSHWIGVAAGWASLFAAIYFFYLARGAGKQKTMILHGTVEEPPANRLGHASAQHGRTEQRRLRFLIVFFIVTFLLVATFV